MARPDRFGFRGAVVLLLVLAMSTAGCVRSQTTVAPAEVLAHAQELQRLGRATVTVTPKARQVLQADTVVEAEFDGGPLSLSIAQLVADCPSAQPAGAVGSLAQPAPGGDSAAPVCLLASTSSPQFVLARHKRVDWQSVQNGVFGGLVGGAIVGGAAYCGLECDYPWNGITVFGSVLAVIIVGVYFWRSTPRPTH